MEELIKSYPLGEGFHAHLRYDGGMIITGRWAEDTLVLEPGSVKKLRDILKESGI